MIPPLHLQVLSAIINRLRRTDINWVLTGSLSFAIQGVAITPNNIDIQTDEAGAYAIEQLFESQRVRPVSFSIAERICSHFGELQIEGVRVEIMGDIQKRCDDGSWEDPANLTQHKRWVIVEGLFVPVFSLEYEYEAYAKLGRLERATMLKRALSGS
jgi:hypothetical protein